MRMLSAFRPEDKRLPVLFLSTHQEDGKRPVSEVRFVVAADTEEALALLLTVESPKPTQASGWIPVMEHRDTRAALEWGRHMAEQLQFVERRHLGEQVYRQYYDQYCPVSIRSKGGR